MFVSGPLEGHPWPSVSQHVPVHVNIPEAAFWRWLSHYMGQFHYMPVIHAMALVFHFFC